MDATPASTGNGRMVALVPLRAWITTETYKALAETGSDAAKQKQDEMLLQKTTVAYGIAELLKHARDHLLAEGGEIRCDIDNFAVRVASSSGNLSRTGVRGMEMLSPRLSVEIVEPSFLSPTLDDSGADSRRADPLEGQYLEVEFGAAATATAPPTAVSQRKEDSRCHALGILLRALFSRLPPSSPRGNPFLSCADDSGKEGTRDRAIKKARRQDSSRAVARAVQLAAPTVGADREGAQSPLAHRLASLPLVDPGLPSSLCLLVKNLLECGEDERLNGAYDSLETVSQDLHLLLLDPRRFLLDRPATPDDGLSGTPRRLFFCEDRLYGRENEVSLITDAFCRVSSGQSEAMFIAGFSGSGKSRLVGSLTARVAAAGGHVLESKFNEGSQERSLLEVIAVFNKLCLLIRDQGSPGSLQAAVKNLKEEFGANLSVLRLLLSNVEALIPSLRQNHGQDHNAKERDDQMDVRSVSYTLKSFMRAVSSTAHPVVLFLDDLQWCDKSALAVIEGLFSDTSRSGCCFFVGSYRSNEVEANHAIFGLLESLRNAHVPTTTLNLEGLCQTDLNTMVSDALGTFPRVCKPLSDIVFQKTKGNPFFVLEFLRSLQEKSLLEYDTGKRMWTWDEDRIGAMDVTGNVLHILSSKMSRLPERTQSALKVAACFGVIKEPIVRYLPTSAKYSNIQCGLKHAEAEDLMIKIGVSEFKFVHDKVREAAYSLIPKSEKNEYHFRLGMTLHAMTKGSNVDDIIFPMVDQINHGINDSLHQSQEMIPDLVDLNEMAGLKAVDCCDYVTARAYLNTAHSLLPVDSWKSNYDQSLRIFCVLAKVLYACADMEKAQELLNEILRECKRIEDSLQPYSLLVTILIACGEGRKAYITCYDVLTQLGETIPQIVDSKEATRIVEDTSKALQNMSGADLLAMKKMDDRISISLKFYSQMSAIVFFETPHMFSVLVCKMVALIMKHGMCIYSIIGLCSFAVAKASSGTAAIDIEEASRIGKAALFCLEKRFCSAEIVTQVSSIYLSYYGMVAFATEPLQVVALKLRQGFDAGMSAGNSAAAFLNENRHINVSYYAGETLQKILQKIDAYLTLTNLYQHKLMKSHLLIFRDTISTLIDQGKSTSSNADSNCSENAEDTTVHTSRFIFFHRASQAFWLGHTERCHHYFLKVLQLSVVIAKLANIIATFYQGLNTFQLLKRQNTAKLRAITRNAIKVLKAAQSHSDWNFSNKVYLLEAENFSFCSNKKEATSSYAAAISSARSSGFIHEQGLACELAGFHHKKIGEHEIAWDYFKQAKQCYSKWGSQVKVDSISRQLETF